MSAIIPWLLANWLPIALGLAFAMTFLALLIIGGAWAGTWYFWHWVIEAFKPEPEVDESLMGDIPHVPAAAKRLHPTKGYGWASRRGKRANG